MEGYPTLTPRPTCSLSPLWFTKAPMIRVAGSGVRRFSNTPPIMHRLFIIPGYTHKKVSYTVCFLHSFHWAWHLTERNVPRKTMLASGSSIWYPKEVVVSCVLVLASNSTPTWIWWKETHVNAHLQYAPKVNGVFIQYGGMCCTCLLALW